MNDLIDLYEAWNKPEEAEEWRARLSQVEAAREGDITLEEPQFSDLQQFRFP